MPVRKGRQKGLRVSSFALLLIVMERHHGSEAVHFSGRLDSVMRGGGHHAEGGPHITMQRIQTVECIALAFLLLSVCLVVTQPKPARRVLGVSAPSDRSV